MMSRWVRYGACLAGAGLLVMTGCVPTGQLAKGPNGQAAPKAESPEGKAAEKGPSPPLASEPDGYRLSGQDPLVGERIDLFERKKEEWYRTGDELAALKAADVWPEAWQECLQDIELALTGYRGLRTGKESDLQPWAIVGRDLHYFEQGCDQVLATARAKLSEPGEASSAPQSGEVPLPAPEDKTLLEGGEQVRKLFEAGQYQETVTAYETLVQSQTGEKLPRETREFCSRALVKLGRFPEAALLLTDLLHEAGQTIDFSVTDARLLTADVLLAAGKFNEAREVYQGVAKALAPAAHQEAWATAHAQAFAEQDDATALAIYQELLQAYLRFDGQQVPPALADGVGRLQGRPPGPLLDLARMLLTKATAQAQEWARGELTEVRTLIDRQELGPARALLDRVAAAAPAEMREAIAALQAELVQAEAVAGTPPSPAGGEVPVDPWDEALRLFEQKRYDEAITVLQTLVDGEHGAEARAKVAEAAELAAAAMRQQAAALYAKARKTFDPEAKRQALQDSRALLLELIERYPEASVVTKARQNLKVLDGELNQAGQPSSSAPVPAEPDAADPQ